MATQMTAIEGVQSGSSSPATLSNLDIVETEALAAWEKYRQAEPLGLDFGKKMYALRESLSARGKDGEGFSAWLHAKEIPRSTAYFWVHRYEVHAIGLKFWKAKIGDIAIIVGFVAGQYKGAQYQQAITAIADGQILVGTRKRTCDYFTEDGHGADGWGLKGFCNGDGWIELRLYPC